MKNKTINKALFLICLLFVTSCISQRRCFRKYPPQVHTETRTTIKDSTIYTRVQKFDTVLIKTLSNDTVILRNETERVTIKYLYRGDTVYIQAICDPDTIVIEKILEERFIKEVVNDFEVRIAEGLKGVRNILIILGLVLLVLYLLRKGISGFLNK